MTTILAVDDKQDNLIVVSALLKHLMPKCHVMIAQSGPEGLKKAREHQPDAVLLDIIMPEMDGYEVCRQLKADERTRHIPVIMLTAIRTDSSSRAKGLECGAISFLTKPIDEVELVAQINVALRIKKAEDQLRQEKATLEDTVQERTLALRDSRELLKRFMDSATDGLVVMDSQLNILEVNNAALKIFEIDKNEALGKPVTEISPTVKSSGRYETYLDVIKSGKPAFLDISLPHSTVGKMYVSVKAFKVGEGLGVIYTDITARKKAEEALRRSEHKFKSVSENAPDIIFNLNSDGEISYVNPVWQFILGHDRTQVIGRKISHFINPDDMEGYEIFMRQIKEGKRTVRNFSCTLMHENGSSRLFNMSGAPKFNGAGNVVGLVGHLEDITERRRLEIQLRQAQKMEALGTLSGGIAHDFNNILFAIMGYSEVALYDMSDRQLVQQSIQQIIQAAIRARDLVQQILSFSKPSDEVRKPVQVHLIVKEVIKMLRATLPSSIDIQHRIDVGNDTVFADPTQIHQILMNLCTNAQHAIDSNKGTIEIDLSTVTIDKEDISLESVLKPGDYIKLSVRDTGCGMDSQTLERIFDPYFSTKPSGEGTGLGLAVIHGIVKSLAGGISVNSKPGKGSRFDILLPRLEEQKVLEKETDEKNPGGDETILFVDDEETLVNLGRQMLSTLGYNVQVEKNSMKAFELFRCSPDEFNLVITDLTMPRLTGIELAEKISAVRPDLPIILCTGYSDQVSRKNLGKYGIKRLLLKPFSIREIARNVREVLDKEKKKISGSA